MRQTQWLPAALAAAALCLVADGAGAEGFADLRFGGSFTDDAKQTLEVDGAPSGGGSGKFDDSLTGGGRVGYFFQWPAPWLEAGVALDASYFSADENPPPPSSCAPSPKCPKLELDVVPITPMLMVRFPLLRSDALPHGRILPYAGVGPGIFLTLATLDLAAVGGPKVADLSAEVGLDVRGGVRLQLLPWLSVFGEYRFTHVEPRFKENRQGSRVELDTKLESHHGTVGIGFHF